MGSLYRDMKQFDTALIYFKKSLAIPTEINYKAGIAQSLIFIGAIYHQKNNDDSALIYYKKSLKIREELNDLIGISACLNNMALIMLQKSKLKEAILYSERSLEIVKDLGYPNLIKKNANTSYLIQKQNGDYKNALLNYELFIKMRDSISNKEIQKASIKSQLKYEYEKKAAADSVKVAEEKKLTVVKLKQEKTQRYFLYSVLGLTILFALFMFNRLTVT